MAHRHHHESSHNSTCSKHPFFCLFKTAEFKYCCITVQVLPRAGRVAVTLKGLVPLHRQEATCGTIPFPTSSNWSPTVWRCMPTQYRDSTKLCWTTSPRSVQLCFGSRLDLGSHSLSVVSAFLSMHDLKVPWIFSVCLWTCVCFVFCSNL